MTYKEKYPKLVILENGIKVGKVIVPNVKPNQKVDKYICDHLDAQWTPPKQ